ncbi:hypothetical protein Poli38472_008650 [Pythium oligandrum]|uniref:MLO-like protein n=1 Tax=Pythium oligandrum TaxID=41045 RepID=A0A8K1C3X0_PYTOL|nr:hypothetical protein Poli38472_008650 [Pythium oligandrum]|eukprot:TMW56002.1 hypothetical protein Poli38472_008650 [Pythium oligandrum]
MSGWRRRRKLWKWRNDGCKLTPQATKRRGQGGVAQPLLLLLALVSSPFQNVTAHDMLRGPAVILEEPLPLRRLGEDATNSSNVCHNPGSFLGVGNVDCLHDNLGTAIFLIGIIIVVSILFERGIHAVRRAIACPQLKKIVNRIFEEVMIMGFISMVIFTLNTSGLMKRLQFKFDDHLSVADRLHFYEFFHYIVFLTMIYFILIVLLLLFIGTVVPKLIWEMKNPDEVNSDSEEETSNMDEEDLVNAGADKPNDEDEDVDTLGISDDRFSRRDYASGNSWMIRQSALRARANSGMDLVQGSRAYALLLQRYQREGWGFRFNLRKQWNLWRSFEILAYNICQHRSGYIYKNPAEMERLFDVSMKRRRDGRWKKMTYEQYHVLCMRNMLFNISHLHYSSFFILLVIAVVPVLYPAYDHWIFIAVGGSLLFVNVVILVKVLRILRGIVDDRLRIITDRDIQRRMIRASREAMLDQPKRRSLRVVALSVRAVIRMQMSALCHQQLHFHNDRFWFNSPRFLLRLFHFATIGQAFYLVWFSLVEWQTVAAQDSGFYLIPIMVLLPFTALCVITPLTMPSLVLVLSLTGIFVDLNGKDPESGHRPTQNETKTRIRLMRRSFLRSHYTDNDELQLPPQKSPSVNSPHANNPTTSPSSVFLRMYDSPTAAAQHGKIQDALSPSSSRHGLADSDDGLLLSSRSACGGTLPRRSTDESTRHRRSFDLAAFQHRTPHTPSTPRKGSVDMGYQFGSPQATNAAEPRSEIAASSAVPSPAFKNYCSKYGGYPDI